MPPGVRKLALTIHVSASVGWLGAVAAFLALAVAGLTDPDSGRVTAAYVAMDLTTWTAVVPLALAALVSGIVQSLGTPWGLFRHYWVLAKLLITCVATGLLIVHAQPIDQVARAATEGAMDPDNLRRLRIQLLADAALALLALLAATALSVYKPRGLTPYGRRKQREERTRS